MLTCFSTSSMISLWPWPRLDRISKRLIYLYRPTCDTTITPGNVWCRKREIIQCKNTATEKFWQPGLCPTSRFRDRARWLHVCLSYGDVLATENCDMNLSQLVQRGKEKWKLPYDCLPLQRTSWNLKPQWGFWRDTRLPKRKKVWIATPCTLYRIFGVSSSWEMASGFVFIAWQQDSSPAIYQTKRKKNIRSNNGD